MWNQLVVPKTDIPYVGGLCEGYVEGTVGKATLPTPDNPITYGVYPTATAAWNDNKGNHPNELPPAGLSVALYFSLGSTKAGHTAVIRPNGKVVTSAKSGYNEHGYEYPNLDAMVSDYAKHNKGCTYLGWTEYIGKLRIVEWKEENMLTRPIAEILYRFYLKRKIKQHELDALVGKYTADQVAKDIVNSDEYKKIVEDTKATGSPSLRHLPEAIRVLFNQK